jgi:hypothetical protein
MGVEGNLKILAGWPSQVMDWQNALALSRAQRSAATTAAREDDG